MCFSFLMSICKRYFVNREDMMSAVNVVYVKIIKNLPAYIKKRDNIPFELWIRRIAINHIVDEFRKNKAYKEHLDFRELHDAEHLHPTADPGVSKEKLEEINEAIEKLPQMNKTVFNLYVVDGYKHEEIAQMLHISSGTSKVHLHRARLKLKEMLKNEWKKKVLTPERVAV